MSSPGETVGPWRLVRELGRGGMGEVWLARDGAGREVALKLLPAGAALDPEAVVRFEREASALARLAHPGIVRCLGADLRGARPWLALELLAGGSLQELLRRQGPLEPGRAVRLATALADALHAAHLAGLVHRDVKPHNVLLDGEGAPRLTDFGLVRLLRPGATLTATGAILGSPGYLAPEQVRGAHELQGPATDVWGLGATLYALLTGAPPFVGSSALESLSAVLEGPPPPPSRLRPGLDPALDAIVLRCLAAAPSGRYPTAQALAGALRAWSPAPAARPRARAARYLALIGVVGAAGALPLLLARRPGAPTRPASPPATAEPVPAGPGSHVAEVRRLVEVGDLGAALARATRGLEAVPGDPELLELRGSIRTHRGDLAGALQDLDVAVAARPTDPVKLLRRGQVRLMLGDLPGALQDFDAVLALAPRLTLAWQSRGDAHLQRGVPAAALADYDRALELGSDSLGQLFHHRGKARSQLGDLEGARADFTRAVESSPRSSPELLDLLLSRSEILGRLGRLDEALDDVNVILARQPRHVGALANRALARDAKGDRAGALQDARAALEQAPDDANLRAMVERLTGR